jgi:hypothetical protein
VLVSDDKRSVGNAYELEEESYQRTLEDHLGSPDTLNGKNHLLVNVPKTYYFAEDYEQNGNYQMQGQGCAESPADVGLGTTTNFDSDESLGGNGQRAGDDGEGGDEIANDGIDGKIIDAEHTQDDARGIKVDNQHKRRTQVQRYCVAGQLALIMRLCA